MRKKLDIKEFNITSAIPFFIKHSIQENKRSCCNYLLSCSSIFVAAIIAMLSQSVISQTPILYLKLAEQGQGQMDMQVVPNYHTYISTFQKYINHSRVEEMLAVETPTNPAFNLVLEGAPRKSFSGYMYNYQSNVLLNSTDIYNAKLSNSVAYMNLLFIDSKREKSMRIGTEMEIPEMNEDECAIPKDLANQFSIASGSYIILYVYNYDYEKLVIAKENANLYIRFSKSVSINEEKLLKYSRVMCKVKHIHDGYSGKTSSSDSSSTIFMELKYAHRFMSKYVNPRLYKWISQEGFVQTFLAMNPYHYADYVIINLPDIRENYYQYNDFDYVKKVLTSFSDTIVNKIGYYSVRSKMGLLSTLSTLNMGGVFLGIMMNLIIIILCVISVLLIYSLLMVSIETKTFDLGVMRMEGLSKYGIIVLITIQASMFVIPALILAFILIFPLLNSASSLLQGIIGVGISGLPTVNGIIYAIFIGILVPFFSAIFPIYSATKKTLSDSLDTSHSKTSGVHVTIEYAVNKVSYPMIIFGVISILFGVSVYYLLPLSLLTQNLQMMLWIMLSILLAIIVALILISLNFQHLLQKLCVYLILFYERASMKTLVLKCLVAHKVRNQRTAITYALSLSFIIFTIVAFDIEVQNTLMVGLLSRGSLFYMSGYLNPEVIEPQLLKIDGIQDFAWVSKLPLTNHSILSVYTSDYAIYNKYSTNVLGLPPNFFNVTDSKILDLYYSPKDSSYSLGERLYSPTGTQSLGVSTYISDKLELSKINSFLLVFEKQNVKLIYPTKSQFVLTTCSGFNIAKLPVLKMYDSLISIPLFLKLSNTNHKILSYDRLLIVPSQNANVTDLYNSLSSIKHGGSVWSYYTYKSGLRSISNYLNLIFMFVITVFMFLCYFSLSSSMTTNIFEQIKEIAVIRAEGMSKIRVTVLYIYEAFILVFSSSLIGVLIGSVIAFSFTAQRALWSNLPVIMTIPGEYIGIIFGASVGCALLCAISPSIYILRKPVSTLIK